MFIEKHSIRIISRVIVLALLTFFLVRTYLIGVHINYMDWTAEITTYKNINIIGIILSLVGFMVALATRKTKSIYASVVPIALIIASLCLVVMSLVTSPDWDRLYEQEKEKYPAVQADEENIHDIEWVDLLEKMRTDKYYLLYVGRDNCDQCTAFKPMLRQIAYSKGISVLYYNTIYDREKSDFDQKMKTVKVSEVPAVRIIGYDNVIEIGDSTIYTDEQSLNVCLTEAKEKYKLDAE